MIDNNLPVDVSIIVPLFNEENNVNELVKQIRDAFKDQSFEIILIDDGSLDKTKELIAELSKDFEEVKTIFHSKNLGIYTSWISGTNSASGKYIAFIDGDLQNPPTELVKMIEVLKGSPVDIVQGVRSSIGRIRDTRFYYSRFLNSLLNLFFLDKSTDSKSSFLVGYQSVVKLILSKKFKYKHFQTFIGISAKKSGYQVLEYETFFLNRRSGESFITNKNLIRIVLEVLSDFPKAFIEFNFRKKTTSKLNIYPRYRGLRKLLFELYFITFPLHKWVVTRNVRKKYFELKYSEWFSQKEMKELQFRKLSKLLHHSFNTVPYYRNIMLTNGINPQSIQSLTDLASIPLLSKEEVRNNLHFSLFSNTHQKKELHKITTSGSTGQPFICYADRSQLEIRFATTLRALEWTGWKFGDRQARLWHQTIGMSKSQVIKERIDAILLRRLFIPAFEFSPDKLEKYFNKLQKFKPILIDGYAESLNFLALYIKSNKIRIQPKAVISSAQALPNSSRNIIEESFGTKVYDKYGSREFSGIAYQCGENSNHHVQDESYIVEIIKDGKPALPGEIGEVIITDLNNFSVPLIRYRVGDLATAVEQKKCLCGRSMSQIGEIQGRTQALVHCADGTWLPGTFFAHFFKDYDNLIQSFQIYQKVKGEFDLNYVVGNFFNEKDFQIMIEELKKYTCSSTIINTIKVNEIKLIATGKRSPVVSELSFDFQKINLI